MEDNKPNEQKARVLSMDEWRKRAVAKIQSSPVTIAAEPISKEELVAWVKTYITMLESHLQGMTRALEKLLAEKEKMERQSLHNITWDEKVLKFNEELKSKTEHIREHIARGKFLLSREDVEPDELKEYIMFNIKSLWSEESTP